MNTYTIDQIKKEIQQQGFKHVSLQNQSNSVIVPYNNSKVPVKDRIIEIEKRLKSGSLPDGIYYVLAKNSIGTKVVPETYAYAKGKVSNNTEPSGPVIIHQTALNDGEKSVISYEKALEMQTEIARLTMELQAVTKERDDLLEELDEIEETNLNDAQPSSMEKFFEQVLPVVSPMVDKWFQQRDKSLALMERRLDLMKPTSKRQPEPERDIEPDPARQFIHWFDSAKPEGLSHLGPQLANAYNTADSLVDFEVKLQEISEELHQLYTNFINHE